MDKKTQQIAVLLQQTGAAHHQAFIETDGDDPEWPLWYAEYLKDRLPPLLGHELTKSELVYWVLHLSKRQAEEAPNEPWPQFYARSLVQQLN